MSHDPLLEHVAYSVRQINHFELCNDPERIKVQQARVYREIYATSVFKIEWTYLVTHALGP